MNRFKKRNNLYHRWRESRAGKRTVVRPRFLPAALLFLMVALPLSGFFALEFHTALLQAETERILAWCGAPDTVSFYESSLARTEQERLAEQQAAYADAVRARIDSYPVVTGAMLRRVQESAGAQSLVDAFRYDAGSGELAFRLDTPQTADLPVCLRALLTDEAFADAAYDGYRWMETGFYTAQFRCRLAAPRPKEDTP